MMLSLLLFHYLTLRALLILVCNRYYYSPTSHTLSSSCGVTVAAFTTQSAFVSIQPYKQQRTVRPPLTTIVWSTTNDEDIAQSFMEADSLVEITTTAYAATNTTTTSSLISAANEQIHQLMNLSSSINRFDMDTALFCAGLAFDSYVEPPANSSRWERGSKGMNVAFLSSAFTRNLYKGLIQVQPISCSDLPEDDSTVESIATGGGVDPVILVAVVEGNLWKEDVDMLQKQSFHSGVFDLNGAAHVGRSRTAWANINIHKSDAAKKKTGKALPYHIPKTWNRSPKAVWTDDEPPFYLYVQDPQNALLVFTLMDDDIIGQGSVISSCTIPLSEYLPQAKYTPHELLSRYKREIISKMKAKELDPSSSLEEHVIKAVEQHMQQPWEGELKMNAKPRIPNKNGQITIGAAAGAWLAGPVGAAAGAALGALYEGRPRGILNVRLRYIPIPTSQVSSSSTTRPKKYTVLGGMPGITWGKLYHKYLTNKLKKQQPMNDNILMTKLGGDDLEHCFFINHDTTGASCAVYRSLEQRLIVVSFRGTCQPIDLLTDASIFQLPWVEGEYEDEELTKIPKVHVGFRRSLDSISRRLKELILAAVAEGDRISDYDILVTGHSLGGALATLFVADIAEYGLDAGRALPQKKPSEPWWKSIANTFIGQEGEEGVIVQPPRPKSIRMYNFGSPRVGDSLFAEQFERLMESGRIQQAYRIVNAQDVIARVPRPMLNIDYEHCGRTVLIEESNSNRTATNRTNPAHVLWIEGESDFDRIDPVRDFRNATQSPLAAGTLLDELVKVFQTPFSGQSQGDAAARQQDAAVKAIQGAAKELQESAKTTMTTDVDKNDPIAALASLLNLEGKASSEEQAAPEKSGNESKNTNPVLAQLGAVASRLSKASLTDLTSVIGMERNYVTRELKIAQSLLQGEALAHHLEDSYYMALGRSVGFIAAVGEDITELQTELMENVLETVADQLVEE